MRPQLYYLYIQSLLVHELGHVMALTKLWTPDYGGPHEVTADPDLSWSRSQIVKIILGDQCEVVHFNAIIRSASQADVKLK